MTKGNGENPQKTDLKVSLIGGHRLAGATLHERTVTASLIGGADVDLTDIAIPDGAALRITKLSLISGVSLKVHRDVRVEVPRAAPGRGEGRRPEQAGRPDGPDRRLGPGRRRQRQPRLAKDLRSGRLLTPPMPPG